MTGRGALGSGALAVLAAGLLVAGCGQSSEPATEQQAPAPAERTSATIPHPATAEHAFMGKVEAVDPAAGTVSVNNEPIEGWMNSMTMTYAVNQTDVLKDVKVGDTIAAKVYDGDYHMLYDVKVAEGPKAP
jgi:Cu/Ag efflux protein CusF